MPRFQPAADLSARLYRTAIEPALAGVPHAAGLLGPGSEVLGYDTERSTDHDWAPGATVLVAGPDLARARGLVEACLPDSVEGWPTRAGSDRSPVRHRVTVAEPGAWLVAQLGLDPRAGTTSLDWLAVPQQLLLHVVAGPVWRDDPGDLTRARAALAAYPDDVRWWLLACQWQRVAQEEPLVQRTAEVGDALGSAVLAGRLVRDAMRLALLVAGRYAPYGKWLGTAFARSEEAAGSSGDGLAGHLAAALAAPDDTARDRALAASSEALARRHLRLPGAGALDPAVRPFHDRPALVLDAARFAADCLRHVHDPVLLALPLVGGVDQLVDSTDLLARPDLVPTTRAVYAALADRSVDTA